MSAVYVTTVATETCELPEITTVDLSDLLSAEERAVEIRRRDADAALNLETQAEDVILSEYYGMPLEVPDELTWIREASELLFP